MGMTREKLEADRARLIERLQDSDEQLGLLNREINSLLDRLTEMELLKNKYYNGLIRIIAESSVWLPSRAMRDIAEDTLYGEEKGI